jgi:hypothetical protein
LKGQQLLVKTVQVVEEDVGIGSYFVGAIAQESSSEGIFHGTDTNSGRHVEPQTIYQKWKPVGSDLLQVQAGDPGL